MAVGHGGRPRRFGLEHAMHAFMASVLGRRSGLDAFD
jgi:hypothetical protein